MDYICTWFCADKEGEESKYHQTGEISSSQKHQNIYWRCIVVFFMTSRRFNTIEKHLFFTNVRELPTLDGRNLKDIFNELDVEVIHTDFKYKTPAGYYGAWRNQFYEFSILEYIAHHYNDDSQFLILDSDCVFLKPVSIIFNEAKRNNGFLSYIIDYPPKHIVNGITREDMESVYKDLLSREDIQLPDYHAGEFMLCSTSNVKKIYSDFLELWQQLLERHNKGLLKFNEEAHTLSFLYFKNAFIGGGANAYIRRIWSNPVFLRNVEESDKGLIIWHLPAEKTYGIERLYYQFMENSQVPELSEDDFSKMIMQQLNIPKISLRSYLQYYTHSYQKALVKKVKKIF